MPSSLFDAAIFLIHLCNLNMGEDSALACSPGITLAGNREVCP